MTWQWARKLCPALPIVAQRGGGRLSIRRAVWSCQTRSGQKSTERELFSAGIERSDETIRFRFHGDSFLNHMVRNMVRALVKVGEGKFEPAKIAEILAAKNRAASPGSAPASGLYLMRVFYNE